MIKKKGVIGKLEHKEYADWVVAVNEMLSANLKREICGLEYKLTQKEIENLTLKMQLYVKNKLEPSKENADAAKVEYEKFKASLEKKLGMSLENAAIDNVTLEVKDLNALNNSKGG